MDGIFNVLKPPGMTSHDVVGAMRKILQMKKIGHAGTLDPMAAGVLPVFTGQATRFLEYAAHDRKTYRAELTFGFRTDTGDLEGKVLAESPVRDLDLAELKETLQSFVGEGMQVPPMYSAISVGGKKLYKLARQGIVVEREPRPITIHDLSLLTYRKKTLLFEVTCSKGTFIRTLCEDIAKKLAMEGTMSFLLRTKVGDFTLENAHTSMGPLFHWMWCCVIFRIVRSMTSKPAALPKGSPRRFAALKKDNFMSSSATVMRSLALPVLNKDGCVPIKSSTFRSDGVPCKS